MNKTLSIIFVCLLLLFGASDAKQVIRLPHAEAGNLITGRGTTEETCTIGTGDNWVNFIRDDYWNTATNIGSLTDYQNVANSSPKRICRIDYTLYAVESAVTYHSEIWDSTGSTKYGDNSDQQVVFGAAYTSYVFTFSEPYPEPTGDFRVHVVRDDAAGQTVRHGVSRSDIFFGGSGYNVVTANAPRDYDATLLIYYMQ